MSEGGKLEMKRTEWRQGEDGALEILPEASLYSWNAS